MIVIGMRGRVARMPDHTCTCMVILPSPLYVAERSASHAFVWLVHLPGQLELLDFNRREVVLRDLEADVEGA